MQNPKEINLNVKRNLARLSAGLQKVTHLYLKDVDFSLLNTYTHKYTLYDTAKKQIEVILEKGIDSKGEINRESYEKQLADVNAKIADLNEQYSFDIEAQSEAELKKSLEELAFAEFATDEKLLKPILRELTGAEVDMTKEDFPQELAKIIADFFLKMKKPS